MTKAYVDLRFHIEDEVEFEGDDPITRLVSVQRIKTHGATPDELDGIGESIAQTDSLQLFFVNTVPTVLTYGGYAEVDD